MRSVRTFIATAFALLVMCGTASAQRDARDAADRGQRLDLDAIRNDMLQRQLKAPEHPLGLAPPNANQTPPKPPAKRKSSSSSNKNN